VSSHDLKDLLDQVPDTRELVLRRQPRFSAAFDAWEEARDDALDAYRRWRTTAGHEAYAVYRAAQDRADAAQDVLARSQTQTSRTSVS
jgi:acyl-CoA reductase-like NAD-dependent aldehyde dehydrogenase